MKRMIRLAAVLLAWGGTISAATVYAANFEQGAAAQPSSAELSKLAAELAQTAARLAELEKQKTGEPTQSSQRSGSSVRWLTDSATTQASYAKTGDSQILASEIFAEGPRVVQLGTAGPRPALRSFNTGATALAAPTNSSIIRVQATDGDLAPVPEPNPWEEDAPTASSKSGSASCTDSCCDTCCEPSCDGTCDTCCEPSCDSCCDVCCEPSCDGCCDTCCGHGKCPRRCLVTVATEVVFLGADINGERIGYLFEDAVADEVIGLGPGFGDGELDDFYVAPRLTLGIQGECWGIQGRYFHFRAAEHAHDPIQPEGSFANQSFDVNSIFEAYYTDVELTRNFCIHGCKNQFSFGARYAAIEHHENVYARSFTNPTNIFDPNSALITGYGRSNREAFGTGMTFGLNGRKPLFCNACANWFYSARGSILWGPTTNEVETEASANGPGASAASVDGAGVSVDDDLFIGELQAGIEWDFALRCLPAKAFFRIAGEYQYWDASSGFAAAGSFAGIDDTGPPAIDQVGAVAASAPGLIVDLYGVSIGTGFTW